MLNLDLDRKRRFCITLFIINYLKRTFSAAVICVVILNCEKAPAPQIPLSSWTVLESDRWVGD